jgi:hypothetical protein
MRTQSENPNNLNEKDLSQISDSSETSRIIDDPKLKAKLKAEISSPFRLLRQFLFSGAGIAGGLGTVTTIPQVIKAWSIEEERNTALTNVAIDVAAMVIGGGLWKWDTDQGKAKVELFSSSESKQKYSLSSEQLAERENILLKLPVEIQTSEVNETATRIVPLSDLFTKGRQKVVIVTGDSKFVEDAVLTARLEGNNLFTERETIVIPYCAADKQLDENAENKGFGASSKTKLLTAPYIAKPQQVSEQQLSYS